MSTSSDAGGLRRELGLTDAVLLGLGSILGTGAFVTIPLIATDGYEHVFIAVAAAAIVAMANGLSSARLASEHPVSGGTYEYGYRVLHPSAGFAAGWMFLAAKTASCAAAAIAVAEWIGLAMPTGFLPEAGGGGAVTTWALRFAVAAVPVLALTAAAAAGVKRSAGLNAMLVSVVLLGLGAIVVAAAMTGPSWWPQLPKRFEAGGPAFGLSAALAFVAFTGYGRVATLGEEVRDPEKTIPRAVVVTLVLAATLYLLVAWSAQQFAAVSMAANRFGGIPPEVDLLAGVGAAEGYGTVASGLATAGAFAALLSVMFALVLGLSRVVLAMARRGDLPAFFGEVDDVSGSPKRAVWLVGAAVLVAALLGGTVQAAWTFSAFTVLLYYSVTNFACWAMEPEPPTWNRATAIVGLIGCLSLAVFIPGSVMGAGLLTLAVGFAVRGVVRALGPDEEDAPIRRPQRPSRRGPRGVESQDLRVGRKRGAGGTT